MSQSPDPYAPAETEPAPTEDAPPPITAPTPVESLAEQVHREANTIPESNNPSDVVPNRPNIRPPYQPPIEPEPEEALEVIPEPAAEEPAPIIEPTPVGHKSAAELIAEAEAAETAEELDAIEAQVEGRVTVQNAVDKRRDELGL